jgi:predicted transcriptional regulator of viral defense system
LASNTVTKLGIGQKMASNHDKMRTFLDQHPVFTLDEFRKELGLKSGSRVASDMMLHQKKMKRIGTATKGLYYVVRPGQTAIEAPVDAFLLASKLAPDSVLAYHTALDLKGFGHSFFNKYYYFTNRPRPACRFRQDHFRAVLTPEKLQQKSKELVGTEKVERLGVKLIVTENERTLVEALERPQYCGGFEEMYRSLEKIPFVRPESVLEYLDLREQKNLYARVGFWLEQHREDFQIEDAFLQRLARRLPRQPLYWAPQRKGGALVKRWNLIVPEAVKTQRWGDS